ncbi:hypothetical protein OFR22_13940 [Brachyspira hyodysenteriae]|uniref:hypothetical protein n=1 Tax=Brachyspira hyodysenteriae TaxID=159 RepID=UPI00063DB77F|nr:hypothetical protein [Brachyspira hyodysenteriae]AUJ49053.1 hypothetical protein BH718_00596 [Brachyspira hyodysenteriae]KLI27018.1 hypothetical protein SR30_03785 [Brachyspira hyodysenteriae]KLI48461.1 hypothetical protein SZ42_10830 [Brachyspira hyodysenteriae]MCZ9838869.1 hypothetical protein [Brachyspira hyodysenteriae]MCZ9848157.1 hypothetical protein [Brachyspira hyodysenteriae]
MYIYKYILCILFIFSFNLYCITSVKISDSFYSITSVNDGITDINDVVFEDYSINLSTIDFPKLSTFFMVQSKIPILSIFLNLYEFMGYDKNVETSVSYLNFFRTLKTIEWYFLGNRKVSAFFTYSSSMNINYNTMIRDLSASYSRFYTDTNILLGIYFHF